MNANALVTVAVPFYNEEKYLARCLDSIISQTYKNLEILLINNNSSDKSMLIANEYAQNDARIIVHECLEQGLFAARNKALDCFNGDYIFFVDADDSLELTGIESLLSNAIENNTDFVVGSYFHCYESLDKKRMRQLPQFVSRDKESIHGFFLSEGLNSNHAWGKLYKRDVFSGVRYESIPLYEDIEILPKLIENISCCSVIETPVYNYFIRKKSISDSDNIEYQYEGFLARLKNRRIYKENYPGLESLACNSVLFFAFFLMGRMYRSGTYGKEWDSVLSELSIIKKEKQPLRFSSKVLVTFSLLLPHPAAAMFCLYSKIKNRM